VHYFFVQILHLILYMCRIYICIYCWTSQTRDATRVVFSGVSVGVVHVLCACAQVQSTVWCYFHISACNHLITHLSLLHFCACSSSFLLLVLLLVVVVVVGCWLLVVGCCLLFCLFVCLFVCLLLLLLLFVVCCLLFVVCCLLLVVSC